MKKITYRRLLTILPAIAGILLILGALSYPLFNTNDQTSSLPPKNKIESNATQVLGNPIDVGLLAAMDTINIRDSKEKVSIRFTAKYSGDANAIVVNLLTGKQQVISVGLQEDNNGLPSGEWINKNGFGTAKIVDKGFNKINLQQAISLSKGRVYHVVIKPANENNATNEGIPVKVYPANNHAQPFNDENLDTIWPDTAMDTLFYNGKEWQEKNNLPIFVIKYSNGRSEGQPYSLDAPWVIFGKRYVGQVLVPSSDYQVEKISFVLNANGTPKDKLYYEIRDSGNQTIKKGVFSEPSQLTIKKKWVEANLDPPVLLQAGKLYRFILLSPKTDLKNSYQVIGHEFTYDNNIGYGGLQNYLTISYDSGKKWDRWDDADTIFKLTAISYRP